MLKQSLIERTHAAHGRVGIILNADHPSLTGIYEDRFHGRKQYHRIGVGYHFRDFRTQIG
jgi:hypothetical protein